MHARRLFELWSEVEYLQVLARRRLTPDHPIHLALSLAVDVGDDEEPEMEKLQAAKRAFYAMNPLHLSQALAGWAPQPEREPGEHVREQHDVAAVMRVVELIPSSRRGGLPAIAVQTFEQRDSFEPVRVTIAEGTTLAQVHAALREVEEMLERDWHRLIGQTTRTCLRCAVAAQDERQQQQPAAAAGERKGRNKKGGSSKRLTVPTPASKRNARARESMAAA